MICTRNHGKMRIGVRRGGRSGWLLISQKSNCQPFLGTRKTDFSPPSSSSFSFMHPLDCRFGNFPSISPLSLSPLIPYLGFEDAINTLPLSFAQGNLTPQFLCRTVSSLLSQYDDELLQKECPFFSKFSNSKDDGTVPPVESSSISTDTNRTVPSRLSGDKIVPRPPTSATAGLTFLSTLSENMQRPTNVIESSAFKSPATVISSIATSTAGGSITHNKRDPGGIGFLDDVGGSVDGLMSCTESLGFESSDERRVDDDDNKDVCSGKKISLEKKKMMRKIEMRKEKKSFPPPLSSLTKNGKPNFFLQPVRKDGRLELTEVKIHRPEILQASRQDGRLRLNFICEEEEEEEVNIRDCDPEEEIEKNIVEVKEDKEGGEGWRVPVAVAVSGGSGDSLRRCHELAGSRYHSDNLNVWRSIV